MKEFVVDVEVALFKLPTSLVAIHLDQRFIDLVEGKQCQPVFTWFVLSHLFPLRTIASNAICEPDTFKSNL